MLHRHMMSGLVVLLLCGGIAAAQPAATPAPATPPAAPREPPSNDEAGISAGRYIGDANTAIAHVSHDVMFTRAILTQGDPAKPGNPGAVLTYNKEIVLATLPGHNETPMTQLPEQLILYVESGEGRLDDGKQMWDLKPGIAILIPPGLAHRFTATTDKPVEMLMLSRTLEPDVTPRKDILVRDVNRMALTERNVHWNNEAKYVFLGPDGLYPTDRILIVLMSPFTIAGAHAHSPGQEECWVKLTDGPALMQIGSEIRDWTPNMGMMAPPNGETVHAAFNLSHTQTQSWFYFARLSPARAPAAGGRGAARPQDPERTRINSVIADALKAATIAGRPLPR